MRRRCLTRGGLIAALSAALLVVNGVRGRAQTEALVLSDVTVIDGTGAPSRSGMTIVIRDGRIADLFPNGEREVPSGAQTIDVSGRYVMPGLIDTHVQLATTARPASVVESLLRATLLGGVTSVRDMGGNGAVTAELARTSRAANAISPRIYVSAVFAGPQAFWFTGARAAYLSEGHTPGSAPWLVRVDNRTNIRDAVRRAKAWGATGVTLHSQLSSRQMRAIAGEARREGMAVWSRAAVGPGRPRDAIDARAVTLSHAADLVWQGRTGLPSEAIGAPEQRSRAMAAVPADDAVIADVLRRMRDRGVLLEPVLYAGAEAASFADDDRPALDEQVVYAARVTAVAQELGVRIAAGTGAVGGAAPNLHAELQLLVNRAGLTPLQAIRAATVNAAQAIGAADIGTVAVGQRADLLILERNPAADIRNTQTVIMVLRDGTVHRRTEPMPTPPLADPPAP